MKCAHSIFLRVVQFDGRNEMMLTFRPDFKQIVPHSKVNYFINFTRRSQYGLPLFKKPTNVNVR